jgi:outer membrane lipoprotein-sorting protein
VIVIRLVLLFISVLFASPVHADAARGRAVAEAEHAASHGYGDLSADIHMDLVSATGKVTSRRLQLKQLETGTGQVMTLVIFDLPRAIADTALLTWSNVAADDDQWLYLPSMKRVKKIASKDRSGPFVGSTFAYEDLADYAVDEFSYTWLREEACASLTCEVIERTPADPYSGYRRQLVWIDKGEHRVRRIDYFDQDDKPLKTLVLTEFASYPVGVRNFVQAHRLTMTNQQTGRSTVLRWSPYRYATGLNATRDFSTNALKRVR